MFIRTLLTGKIGSGNKVHTIVQVEDENGIQQYCFCGAGIVNKPNKSGLTLIDAEVTCTKCHSQAIN